MKLTDPHGLLRQIDLNIWDAMRGGPVNRRATEVHDPLSFVEPNFLPPSSSAAKMQETGDSNIGALAVPTDPIDAISRESLRGKVQQLGDFVDTDAV